MYLLNLLLMPLLRFLQLVLHLKLILEIFFKVLYSLAQVPIGMDGIDIIICGLVAIIIFNLISAVA